MFSMVSLYLKWVPNVRAGIHFVSNSFSLSNWSRALKL